jgi:hypothetical protein
MAFVWVKSVCGCDETARREGKAAVLDTRRAHSWTSGAGLGRRGALQRRQRCVVGSGPRPCCARTRARPCAPPPPPQCPAQLPSAAQRTHYSQYAHLRPRRARPHADASVGAAARRGARVPCTDQVDAAGRAGIVGRGHAERGHKRRPQRHIALPSAHRRRPSAHARAPCAPWSGVCVRTSGPAAPRQSTLRPGRRAWARARFPHPLPSRPC